MTLIDYLICAIAVVAVACLAAIEIVSDEEDDQ